MHPKEDPNVDVKTVGWLIFLFLTALVGEAAILWLSGS